MKGILLAAGRGTRLKPITHILNKTILPVFRQPMFYYALKTLLDSGIEDIIIVVDPRFGLQIKTLVKHYPSKIKARIRYCVQQKPLGIVDAIRATARLVGKSNIIVCPGDNIFSDKYEKSAATFKSGAIAFLRKVKDPERFGTPHFTKRGIVDIILEKPEKPQTKFAVTAPYIFDNQVFELIKQLKPSKRGELEITDLMNLYLDGNNLKLEERKSPFYDSGTFESLLATTIFVSKNPQKFFPN
jgi:glucose-1-phosphate thymidylyltransferase